MTNTLQARMKQALAHRPGTNPADLARACGVTQPSVHGWLSGETKSLKATSARRAAQFLGCDPAWLADGVGLPNWRSPLPDDRPNAPVRETVEHLALLLSELPAERMALAVEHLATLARAPDSQRAIAALAALLDPAATMPEGSKANAA